jgi:hypothetical protein
MAASKKAYPNTWDGVMEAARVVGAKFPELVAAQWAPKWGRMDENTSSSVRT